MILFAWSRMSLKHIVGTRDLPVTALSLHFHRNYGTRLFQKAMSPMEKQRNWQHVIWCLITNTQANTVAIVSSKITTIFFYIIKLVFISFLLDNMTTPWWEIEQGTKKKLAPCIVHFTEIKNFLVTLSFQPLTKEKRRLVLCTFHNLCYPFRRAFRVQ